MPDCFISYASQDERLAECVHDELKRHGLSVFVASLSLDSGAKWPTTVLTSLRKSSWVILLASRAACESAFVNQEIGAALAASKQLVPIVWNMSPRELPGWAGQFQAIDLREATVADLRLQIEGIAAGIRRQKNEGLVILGAVILGVLLFGRR